MPPPASSGTWMFWRVIPTDALTSKFGRGFIETFAAPAQRHSLFVGSIPSSLSYDAVEVVANLLACRR